MIAVDASYCPLCGAAVERRETDDRERAYCPDCERVLWRTAVPGTAVGVVENEHVCCIRRGQPPAEGTWALPGGHPEHDEPLPVAAARELAEETAVRVDPADLEPIGTRFAPGAERNHTVVHFTVDRTATTGEASAGDDAADVAFLSPSAYGDREGLHDRGTLEAAISRV